MPPPYNKIDLAKWVKIDYLMSESEVGLEAMVTSANADLGAFIERMSLLGLIKESPPSARHVKSAPSGSGGGGSAVPSSRCLGSICGGHGIIARAGTCDRCLVAMEAADKARRREREADDKRREREADDKARREIEADRRRRAAEARREREVVEAIEAAEIEEAEERRQRNAREIGVQLVGSRHLDANADLANRQVDMRRIAQQLAVQEQRNGHVVNMIAMPPGSLGGRVIVHHNGGGGAPIAVGINGVPRAVFGPPMINPFPFAMHGFGARHF